MQRPSETSNEELERVTRNLQKRIRINLHKRMFRDVIMPQAYEYILRPMTQLEIKNISVVSKSFHAYARSVSQSKFKAHLKSNFGIEYHKTIDEFNHNLREQKMQCWQRYAYEHYICPTPLDSAEFMNELIEDHIQALSKYGSFLYGAIPCPLYIASSCNMEELLITLIIKGHLKPKSSTEALCFAIRDGHQVIVRHLLNAGASATQSRFCSYDHGYGDGEITVKNAPREIDYLRYFSPLACAINHDRVAIAKLLLTHGASFDDLSFVHPLYPDFNVDQRRTVTQLVDEGRIKLSEAMTQMLQESFNKKLCR